MASLTATADPTTGAVLIQLDRVIARDSFTRVVANSWGSATTIGGAYTVNGVAANYDVNGTEGTIVSVPGTFHSAFLTAANAGNITGDIFIHIPVNPSGGNVDVALVSRRTVGNDGFIYRVRLEPGGPVTAQILYRSAGVMFPLSNAVTFTYTITGTNAIGIRFDDAGGLNRLRMKAWRALTTATEPQSWLIDIQNPVERADTGFGVASDTSSLNTNGAFLYEFDNFRVLVGTGALSLYRVTPDGTETVVRGANFTTQYPEGTATIWDNEAPFDVDVFYVLRSEDNATLNVLTSNTVNLDSGDDVWLRDPYDPSKNLIIDISEVPFDYCDDSSRIMFADLQSKTYDSASGIFEIIDAQRPATVAQTRKRYGSTLYLTSKEATDADAIEAIIAGGYPLLLSLPPVYQFGRPYGTDWVSFATVQSDPPGVDRRLPTRNWVMPFRLSEPAADIDQGNTNGNGIGAGGATYNDLAASALGLTYNSLNAAATTYNAVAAGTGY